MEALRRTLAVYRMVFGQSRQEDLVSYLLTQLPKEEIEEIVAQLRIDLSPRPKVAEPKITLPAPGAVPPIRFHEPGEISTPYNSSAFVTTDMHTSSTGTDCRRLRTSG